MDLVRQRTECELFFSAQKGGPSVGSSGRSNPSTLILINDTPYIVDCGYGASRQLRSAGVSLDRLRYIITHHNSDHNLEYGALLYNSWITGLPIHIDAYGPSGLGKMTQDFFNYMKFDIETRIVDEGRPDPRKLIVPHDFNKPGDVLENDNLKVTTCLVSHPPIKLAFCLPVRRQRSFSSDFRRYSLCTCVGRVRKRSGRAGARSDGIWQVSKC